MGVNIEEISVRIWQISFILVGLDFENETIRAEMESSVNLIVAIHIKVFSLSLID